MEYDVHEKKFSLLDLFPDSRASLVNIAELRSALVAGLQRFVAKDDAWDRRFTEGSIRTVRQHLEWLEKINPIYSQEMQTVEKQAQFDLEEILQQQGLNDDEPTIN